MAYVTSHADLRRRLARAGSAAPGEQRSTSPERQESLDDYRRLWDRRMREGGYAVTSCVSSGARVEVLGDAAVFMHDVVTEVATRAGAETRQERETIVFARQTDGPLDRCAYAPVPCASADLTAPSIC